MALGLLGKKVGMTRVFDAEAGTFYSRYRYRCCWQ